MTRMPMHFAMLLAATLAAWQPSKAVAGEEDTQFWLVANAAGEISDGTRLTIDASQRWREEARGGAQQTIRFSLDHDLAKGLRIGVGGMVLDAGGFTELRPHQQITLVRKRFEFRTRLEQRFFDRADRVELRLRQRVQYAQPLGDGWRANLGGEWLGLLQGRRSGQGASTEQWRVQAGVSYTIKKQLDVGVNYWLIIAPSGERLARYSHTPQAVLSWHF